MNENPAFFPTSELNFNNAQKEFLRLRRFMSEEVKDTFVFNLANTQHCDSAGLALMIEAKRLAKTQNKACIFESVPKALWNLATFCGIESIFN